MTGFLTTHVLDTARGMPASGLHVTLYKLDGEARVMVAQAITNDDGRTDTPIMGKDAFVLGDYELEFKAGDYLRANGLADTFLDVVPLRFKMTQDDHYHVPLLLSPFSFSTYRGS